jgi:hypothetical protein
MSPWALTGTVQYYISTQYCMACVTHIFCMQFSDDRSGEACTPTILHASKCILLSSHIEVEKPR